MSTRYLQVTAPQGMVSSAHFLASQAGVWALRQGGNAVDAAVCAAATIGVVAPHLTGPGGDLFAIVWPPHEDRPAGLNASGRAARGATRDRLRALGHTRMPQRGGLAITVPGAVSGWAALLDRYGTRRLSDLLEPAIDYAEHGAPVTAKLARSIAANASMLMASAGSRKVFFRDGKVLPEGARFINRDLAETLRHVGASDGEAMYRGPLAESVAAGIQDAGGLITVEDMAAHRADWVMPISGDFASRTVYEMPPNTQGATVLELLNMIALTPLASLHHNSAQYVDTLVRLKQLAYADRDAYLTDPDFADIPLDRLLSPAYAAERLQAAPTPVTPRPESDTIYLCAVDKDRMAVSLIQSMYQGFGSGVMARETGLALQNRGSYFSLEESHANRLEPGKRTLHTLIPAMAAISGRPELLFGSMGGDGQPQFQIQVLLNHLVFGMQIQEAIEAPRFLHGQGVDPQAEPVLLVEDRFDATVVAELRRMGHHVDVVEGWSSTMGHAQAIRMDRAAGLLRGGADPRGDGLALGY